MSDQTIQRKRFLQTVGVTLLGLLGLGKVKPVQSAEVAADPQTFSGQVHLHPEPRSVSRSGSGAMNS